MSTIKATLYVDRDGAEVAVEVTGWYSPGSHGRRAAIEDVQASMPLTGPERVEAEVMLWQALEDEREARAAMREDADDARAEWLRTR